VRAEGQTHRAYIAKSKSSSWSLTFRGDSRNKTVVAGRAKQYQYPNRWLS